MEYGQVGLGEISTTDLVLGTVKFTKQHSTAPKAILLTYVAYRQFRGKLQVDYADGYPTADGFNYIYIPENIGNGKGLYSIYWVALW